jgi:hypothetical protein
LRIEQALQVVRPRSVTSHIRRQALESAAESLEPTFALEFPKSQERPRGSVVAFALRASARHLAIARLNSRARRRMARRTGRFPQLFGLE